MRERWCPFSVYGDLEVEITRIQHDSRLVCAGDLFVCCVGRKTDGCLYLTEADKRGAVAVVVEVKKKGRDKGEKEVKKKGGYFGDVKRFIKKKTKK
jgi:UDP-N-acetylmuramyl tripeptide synthase